MRYLSPAEILTINEVAIEETGGSFGVRESGLLESIAMKSAASFGGQDLYPDIYLKAAALYEAIINYHVFIDGNKRTGLAALAQFLHLNGYDLIAADKELESYTLKVAEKNPDLADIAVWIKVNSKKQ